MFKYQSGTTVLNTNGNAIGEIIRVVMNPHTHKVSHLVIRKGFLFPEDKVLSIEAVHVSDDDKLILEDSNLNLDELPLFREEHFVMADEMDNKTEADLEHRKVTPMLYLYPPVDNGSISTLEYGLPPMVRYEEYNVPENTIALKLDAKVITADGKHVGHIEEILVDDETELASHFVISRGLFFKNHKLIPTIWVDSVMEDNVHLTMAAEFLRTLPEYKGEISVPHEAQA